MKAKSLLVLALVLSTMPDGAHAASGACRIKTGAAKLSVTSCVIEAGSDLAIVHASAVRDPAAAEDSAPPAQVHLVGPGVNETWPATALARQVEVIEGEAYTLTLDGIGTASITTQASEGDRATADAYVTWGSSFKAVSFAGRDPVSELPFHCTIPTPTGTWDGARLEFSGSLNCTGHISAQLQFEVKVLAAADNGTLARGSSPLHCGRVGELPCSPMINHTDGASLAWASDPTATAYVEAKVDLHWSTMPTIMRPPAACSEPDPAHPGAMSCASHGVIVRSS